MSPIPSLIDLHRLYRRTSAAGAAPARFGTRGAALLFAGAGALAIVNSWIPGLCPPSQRLTFTGLGLLDLLVAALLVALPWRRWGARALLAVPAVTLVLVDVFAITGRLDPALYSIFLLLLAGWVGLALPRWTTAKLAPAVALAYVVPILVRGDPGNAFGTGMLVVPLVVLSGELVARIVAELRHATLTDELTGAGNRRSAMAALQRVRPGDALLVVDVDHFKQVNDVHGHATGDAVLASLGTMLRTGRAGADTVARLGGEEFLLLLSQARDDARTIADRILADWRATQPATTLSIGVAVVEDDEVPDAALARADRALYDAKRGGRDRAELAQPEPAVRGVPGRAAAA